MGSTSRRSALLKNFRCNAIAAVTLDGRIAAREKQFTDWTSKEDKALMRKLLDGSDAVVVGRNTYESAKTPLSKRNCIVLTRSVKGIVRKKPNLVFVNPHTKRAFVPLAPDGNNACSGVGVNPHTKRTLSKSGNDARSGVGVNPQKANITRYIEECGYKAVALLGGTQTYTFFFEHGLIDELYLTIEPVIFGRGLPLFDGKLAVRKPRIVSVKRLNRTGTVLIHARLRSGK